MRRQLDQNVYPIPQLTAKCKWTRLRRRLFTVKQCDDLLRFAETKGRYYRSDGEERKVEICYVWPQDAPWVYKKIAAMFATENIWGFVLSTIVEPLRIQRYGRGYHTKEHADYDYESTDQSKITAIVPLVGRTSWEGGDLFVQGQSIPRSPDKGDCLLFPSFAWHGVSRVTKGARIVLSAWVAGPRLV